MTAHAGAAYPAWAVFMSDESELEDAIQNTVTEPKAFRDADGSSVEAHNPKDLIEVEKYRKGTTAAASGIAGLQTFTINRPGAVQ